MGTLKGHFMIPKQLASSTEVLLQSLVLCCTKQHGAASKPK